MTLNNFNRVRLHEFEIGKIYTGLIAGVEFQLNIDGKVYAYNTTSCYINHIPPRSTVQVNPADTYFIEQNQKNIAD